MAEDAQGIDPVAWLNRDDVRTEFALEDGGTITSGEIVGRMCSCYEDAKARGYDMTPWEAVETIAYGLVAEVCWPDWVHLSESSVKSLANRTARDDGERERYVARLKQDADEDNPLSAILTDLYTYRTLHAIAWLVAREGWEAAQNL